MWDFVCELEQEELHGVARVSHVVFHTLSSGISVSAGGVTASVELLWSELLTLSKEGQKAVRHEGGSETSSNMDQDAD